jgi:tetratricopeptide (TPR) repeat protein
MASTLLSMADLYQAEGRYAEAEQLLKQWVSLSPSSEDHRVRMEHSLDLRALLDLEKGDIEGAAAAAARSLALQIAKLPGDHAKIAQARWTLARVMIAQGRVVEADKVTDEHVWLKGARATLAALSKPE